MMIPYGIEILRIEYAFCLNFIISVPRLMYGMEMSFVVVQIVLPSVVVPQARNLLLNPLHPAMSQLALKHQEPFRLDQRLA